MKKYITLIVLMLISCIGVVYGCDANKYGKLSYSITYGEEKTTLDIDEGLSLIYGDANQEQTNISIKVNGVKGINTNVNIVSENPEVVDVKNNTGKSATLVATKPGTGYIKISSVEYSSIFVRFKVNVVYPISSIETNFEEGEVVALIEGQGAVNLNDYLTVSGLKSESLYLPTEKVVFERVSGDTTLLNDFSKGLLSVKSNQIISATEKIVLRARGENNNNIGTDITVYVVPKIEASVQNGEETVKKLAILTSNIESTITTAQLQERMNTEDRSGSIVKLLQNQNTADGTYNYVSVSVYSTYDTKFDIEPVYSTNCFSVVKGGNVPTVEGDRQTAFGQKFKVSTLTTAGSAALTFNVVPTQIYVEGVGYQKIANRVIVGLLKTTSEGEVCDFGVTVKNLCVPTAVTSKFGDVSYTEGETVTLYDSYGNPYGEKVVFGLQSPSSLVAENKRVKVFIDGVDDIASVIKMYKADGSALTANSNYYLVNSNEQYFIKTTVAVLGGMYVLKAQSVLSDLPNTALNDAGLVVTKTLSLSCEKGITAVSVQSQVATLVGKTSSFEASVNTGALAKFKIVIADPTIVSLECKSIANNVAQYALTGLKDGTTTITFIAGNGFSKVVMARVVETYKGVDFSVDDYSINSNVTSASYNDGQLEGFSIKANVNSNVNIYTNFKTNRSAITDISYSVNNNSVIEIVNADIFDQDSKVLAEAGLIIKGIDTGFAEISATISYFDFRSLQDGTLQQAITTEVVTFEVNVFAPAESITVNQAIKTIYAQSLVGLAHNDSSIFELILSIKGGSFGTLTSDLTNGFSFKNGDADIIKFELSFPVSDENTKITVVAESLESFASQTEDNVMNYSIKYQGDLGADAQSLTGIVKITVVQGGKESILYSYIAVKRPTSVEEIEVLNPMATDVSGDSVFSVKKGEDVDVYAIVSPENATFSDYSYYFLDTNNSIPNPNDTDPNPNDTDRSISHNDIVSLGKNSCVWGSAIWSKDANGIAKIENGKITGLSGGKTLMLIVANDSIDKSATGSTAEKIAQKIIIDENKRIVYALIKVDVTDGSISNPYVISTAQQLRESANQNVGVNGKVKTYYVLGSTIDLSSMNEWTPIADEEGKFKNHINGYYSSSEKMYSIVGFNPTVALTENFGLFGEVAENAEIVNLNVKAKEINLTISENAESISIGVLTSVNKGLIQNCSVSVNNLKVTNSSITPINVGGMVGTNDGIIRNYAVKMGSSDKESDKYLGSYATYPNGDTTVDTNTIKYSSSTNIFDGKLSINSPNVAVNIGGLVGQNNNKMYGIYSIYKHISESTATSSEEAQVEFSVSFESQGIDATVDINTGSQSVREGSSLGGAVGYSTENAMVKGLSAEGSIGYYNATLERFNINNSYVGGLIGKVVGSIGSEGVTVENSLSSTKIKGNGTLGGLIGYAQNAKIKESKVENYQTLTLYASQATLIKGQGKIGGLIGEAVQSSVTASYAKTYFTTQSFKDWTETSNDAMGIYWGDILVLLSCSTESKVGGLVGVSTLSNYSYVYDYLRTQARIICNNSADCGTAHDLVENASISTTIGGLFGDGDEHGNDLLNFYTIMYIKSDVGYNAETGNYKIVAVGTEDMFNLIENGYYHVKVNNGVDIAAQFEMTYRVFKTEVFNGTIQVGGDTYTFDSDINIFNKGSMSEFVVNTDNGKVTSTTIIYNGETITYSADLGEEKISVVRYIEVEGSEPIENIVSFEIYDTGSEKYFIYSKDDIKTKIFFDLELDTITLTIPEGVETNTEEDGINYSITSYSLEDGSLLKYIVATAEENEEETKTWYLYNNEEELYHSSETTARTDNSSSDGIRYSMVFDSNNQIVIISKKTPSLNSVKYYTEENTIRSSVPNSGIYEKDGIVFRIISIGSGKEITSSASFETLTDGSVVYNGITFSYDSTDGWGISSYDGTIYSDAEPTIQSQNEYYLVSYNGNVLFNIDFANVISEKPMTPSSLAEKIEENPSNYSDWSIKSMHIAANDEKPVLMYGGKPLLTLVASNIDLKPTITDKSMIAVITPSEGNDNYTVVIYENGTTTNETKNTLIQTADPNAVIPEIVLYYDASTSVNVYQLTSLLGVTIAPDEVKYVRVICDYTSRIINIDNSGKLTILGTGEVLIQFYSLLNQSASDSMRILIVPAVASNGFAIYGTPNTQGNKLDKGDDVLKARRNSSTQIYPIIRDAKGNAIGTETVVEYDIKTSKGEDVNNISIENNVLTAGEECAEGKYEITARIYYLYKGLKILACSDEYVFVLNITEGATDLYVSSFAFDMTPSSEATLDILLTTDISNDSVKISLITDNMGLSGKEVAQLKDLLRIGENQALTSVVSLNTISNVLNLSLYCEEDGTANRLIERDLKFKLRITSVSNSDLFRDVEITLKPQQISGFDMSFYPFASMNVDGSTFEWNYSYTAQSTPEYSIKPGDDGLIAIDALPSYGYLKNIQISAAAVNGQYLAFEQLLRKPEGITQDRFLAYGIGKNGQLDLEKKSYLSYNNESLVTYYDGHLYVRAVVPTTIYEACTFEVIISGERSNGDVISEKMYINVLQVPRIDISVSRAYIAKTDNFTDFITYTYETSAEVKDVVATISSYTRGTTPIDNVGDCVSLNQTEKIIGLRSEAQVGDTFELEISLTVVINGIDEKRTEKRKITVVDYIVTEVSIDGLTDDGYMNLMVGNVKTLSAKVSGVGSTDAKERIERAISQQLIKGTNSPANWKYVSNNFVYGIDDPTLNLPFSIRIDHTGEDYGTVRIAGTTNSGVITLRMAFSIYYDSKGSASINSNSEGSNTFYGDFSKNFNVLVYVDPTEDNPRPIATPDQFKAMLAGEHYILTEDITLDNYSPINTAIASLDGNNKVITINNFNISSNTENSTSISLGLFSEVSESTLLKNLIVAMPSVETAMSLVNYSTVTYGGIAAVNNGVITNCDVVAMQTFTNEVINTNSDYAVNILTSALINGNTTTVRVGGLVGINNSIITNSRVGRGHDSEDRITILTVNDSGSATEGFLTKTNPFYLIKVTGSGYVGGFVSENNGTISSSYFRNGQIENNSTSSTFQKTGGFVAQNLGKINGCYSSGWEEEDYTSSDLLKLSAHAQQVEGGSSNSNADRRMGGGVFATVSAGGFVNDNSGEITDCYSSMNMGGTEAIQVVNVSIGAFVNNNLDDGVIKTCYSIGYVNQTKSHGPFTGFSLGGILQNSGEISRCYYLQTLKQVLYKEEDPAICVDQEVPIDLGEDINVSANKFIEADTFGGFAILPTENGFYSDLAGGQSGAVWAIRITNQATTATETSSGYPELISANNIAISCRILDERSVSENEYVYTYAEGYGKGEANNPLLIDSATKMDDLFEKYLETLSQASIQFEAKYQGNIRIVNNLDFSELQSKSIASSSFTLTSLKNEKTIIDGNNLDWTNINLTTEQELQSYGIFKALYNVGVKNINMSFDGVNAANTVAVGGLAGVIVDCDINNITITGTETNSSATGSSIIIGQNYVGGLAGIIVASEVLETEDSTDSDIKTTTVHYINNIITNLPVSAQYDSRQEGVNFDTIKSGEIWNDIIPPSVKYPGSNDTDIKFGNLKTTVGYAGGIAGVVDLSQNFVSQKKAAAESNETSTVAEYSVYGVNVKRVAVQDSVNGSTTTFNVEAENAGGLFGFIGNQTYLRDASFEISKNENAADCFISGQLASGAIAAFNYGRIDSVAVSHILAEQLEMDVTLANFVDAKESAYSIGYNTLFTGSPIYVGGIVGVNSADTNNNTGYITNAYNRIAVRNANAINVGGIAGASWRGEISTVYTTAALLGASNSNIGGIIGSYLSDETLWGVQIDSVTKLDLKAVKAFNVYLTEDYTTLQAITGTGRVGSFVGKYVGDGTDINIDSDNPDNGSAGLNRIYARFGISSVGSSDNNDANSSQFSLTVFNGNIDCIDLANILVFGSEGEIPVDRDLQFPDSIWSIDVWKKSNDYALPTLVFGVSSNIIKIYTADDFLKIQEKSSTDCIFVIMNDIDMSIYTSEQISDASSLLVRSDFRGRIFGYKKLLGRNPILFNLSLPKSTTYSTALFQRMINSSIQNVDIQIDYYETGDSATNTLKNAIFAAELSRTTINNVNIYKDLDSSGIETLYVNKRAGLSAADYAFDESDDTRTISSEGLPKWFEMFQYKNEKYTLVDSDEGSKEAEARETIYKTTVETNAPAGTTYNDYYAANQVSTLTKFKHLDSSSVPESGIANITSNTATFGAIAGRATSSSITNCSSNIDVTVGIGNVKTFSDIYVGGIVGYLKGSMSNCAFNGYLTATLNHNVEGGNTSPSLNIGGVVGQIIGSVTSCSIGKLEATGINVSSNNNSIIYSNVNIGGIVGIAKEWTVAGRQQKSEISGDIVSKASITVENIKPRDNVSIGGIAGNSSNRINSTSINRTGDISVSNIQGNGDQTSHFLAVGKIAGNYVYNIDATLIQKAIIIGNIAISSCNAEAIYVSGGIAKGNLNKLQSANTYIAGNISLSGDASTKNIYVGQLGGQISTKEIEMENTVALGDISVKSETHDNSYIAGLIAYTDALILTIKDSGYVGKILMDALCVNSSSKLNASGIINISATSATIKVRAGEETDQIEGEKGLYSAVSFYYEGLGKDKTLSNNVKIGQILTFIGSDGKINNKDIALRTYYCEPILLVPTNEMTYVVSSEETQTKNTSITQYTMRDKITAIVNTIGVTVKNTGLVNDSNYKSYMDAGKMLNPTSITGIGTTLSVVADTYYILGSDIKNITGATNEGWFLNGNGYEITNATSDTVGSDVENSKWAINIIGGLSFKYDSRPVVSGLLLNNLGITSKNYGIIYNCGTYGAIESTKHIAGISVYNFGFVIRTFSSMDVTSTGSSSWAAGLIARNEETIDTCYATGKVTGRNRTAGLVAGNYDATASENTAYILNSYTLGNVVAGVSGNSLVAKCIQYNGDNVVAGRVKNVYYDVTANNYAGGAGQGMTTFELAEAVFTDLNWLISTNIKNNLTIEGEYKEILLSLWFNSGYKMLDFQNVFDVYDLGKINESMNTTGIVNFYTAAYTGDGRAVTGTTSSFTIKDNTTPFYSKEYDIVSAGQMEYFILKNNEGIKKEKNASGLSASFFAYYKLKNDIDMTWFSVSNREWSKDYDVSIKGVVNKQYKLSWSTLQFKGDFNGNENNISNMTSKNGLFNIITDSSNIYNFTIGTASSSVGGLLGNKITGGTIRKIAISETGTVSAKGGLLVSTVEGTSESTLKIAENIVGILYNSNNITVTGDNAGGLIGEIKSGTVNVTDNKVYNVTITGNKNAGGIVGLVSGGTVTITGNTVNNTKNIGKDSARNTGGIIGCSTVTTAIILENNTVDSAKLIAKTNAGGIAGNLKNATVKNASKGASVISLTVTTATGTIGGVVGIISEGSITNFINQIALTYNSVESVGGIAGEATNTNITSCENTAAITAKTNAGGIAGKATNITITTLASNSGTINGTNAGGIVGLLSSDKDLSLTNTTNSGSITASKYAGGIVGSSTGYIIGVNGTTVTNSGAISLSAATSAGGIVGILNSGTINYTTNTGNVGNSGESPSNAGGIVGQINTTVSIKIENNTTEDATIKGTTVGGIVGYSNSTVIDNININNNAVNRTTLTGTGDAGGIIGKLVAGKLNSNTIQGTSDATHMTIKGTNAGGIVGLSSNIQAKDNSVKWATVTGSTSVGGIVGKMTKGTISNSSTTALEKVVESTLTATSNAPVGGVAGLAEGSATGDIAIQYFKNSIVIEVASSATGGIVGKANNVVVTDCENTGNIKGNPSSGTAFVGGIIGQLLNGEVSKCVNKANVETNAASSDAGGIIGSITKESSAASIFENSVSGSEDNKVNITGNDSGGIIGWSQSTTGTVTIKDNTVDYAVITGSNATGGIIGNLYAGTVTNTTKRIKVTNSVIKATNATPVGGIVGKAAEKQITISNFTNTANINTGNEVGGIIGRMANGTITNCSNSGSIKGSSIAGGIVGNAGNGVIIGDTTTDDIVNSGAISLSAAGDAGGIAGRLVSGTIKNTKNTGNVGNSGESPSNAGGIVGRIGDPNKTILVASTISNNKVEGSITIKGSDIGGIVGWSKTEGADVTIKDNSVSNVTLSNTKTSSGSAGGIVGLFCRGTITNTNLAESVKNCSITFGNVTNAMAGGVVGKVSTKATIRNFKNTNLITIATYVGGIVGYGTSTNIANCENSGNIGSYDDGYAKYAGGIVGYLAGGSISNSKNSGQIQATNVASGTENYGVGGIVGVLSDGAGVSECENFGNISVKDIRAGVGSWTRAGGIAGRDSDSATVISDCVNTGKINAIETFPGYPDDIGGIIGFLNGSLNGCSNYGNVGVDGDAPYYAGGMVGNTVAGSKIQSCNNYGSIRATVHAGGISGNFNGKSISYCYSGAISDQNDEYMTTGVVSNYNSQEEQEKYMNINNISITALGYGTENGHAGGITGIWAAGNISQCNVDMIDISGDGSSGCAGGLVGYRTGTAGKIYGNDKWAYTLKSNYYCDAIQIGRNSDYSSAKWVTGQKQVTSGKSSYWENIYKKRNKAWVTINGTNAGGLIGDSSIDMTDCIGDRFCDPAKKDTGTVKLRLNANLTGTNVGGIVGIASKSFGISLTDNEKLVEAFSIVSHEGDYKYYFQLTFTGTMTGQNAGGFAGYVGGSVNIWGFGLVVSGMSSITVSSTESTLGCSIGGIVGRVDAGVTIESCDVIGGSLLTLKGQNVGGILGLRGASSADFKITKCKVKDISLTGWVSSTDTEGEPPYDTNELSVGGIVGFLYHSGSGNNGCEINDNTVSGITIFEQIHMYMYQTESSNKFAVAGGIIAYFNNTSGKQIHTNNNTVENCSMTAYALVHVYMGGVFGYMSKEPGSTVGTGNNVKNNKIDAYIVGTADNDNQNRKGYYTWYNEGQKNNTFSSGEVSGNTGYRKGGVDWSV